MITYAVLCPHPPLIIPEVGGDSINQVSSTVKAMQDLSREVFASEPDVIVFLTPHGNVFADCLSCLTEEELQGDLGNFGRKDLSQSRQNDLAFVQQLQTRSREQGIDLLGINEAFAHQHKLNAKLDHGILVPLYYLVKAGLKNQSMVAISVGLLDPLDLYRFGKLIQETAADLHRRVAIVASGDMSHRLKEEGPYHYHPDASRFDHLVQDLLEKADVEGLLKIPGSLREHAGECGYPSISIMLGTLDGYEIKSEVFSYEGPFGVGYLTAGLKAGQKTNSVLESLQEKQAALIRKKRGQESAPVKWARLNLEHHITGKEQPVIEGDMQQFLQQKSAAFVSIKKNGKLRGCIGTFLPAYENLAEEIKHNALSAGLRDPRFPPVEADELNSLVYSVDLLTKPEPCTREDLDPKKYGVIVSHSGKRGLLLPDLEGVDTVEEQLLIALQKAGISHREKYGIERFEVKRFY